ncbi:MAG: DUF481 domain-containing protein [Luteolibacter sp.]
MKRPALYLSAVFCLTSVCSAAEESPWEFSGASGLSWAGGNSDSLAYSLQFLGSYMKDGEEVYLGTDYFYSEDHGVRSTDSLKIYGQYNHSLTERFYVGGYGGYFRDAAADIDYRIDPSLLLGYKVIAREDVKLAFEMGPGYTWRKRGGVADDFVTLRLAEKFEWNFSPTSRLWQSVSYTQNVEDFSGYLVDFELGVETRITDSWSLRTFVRHRIDSEPAAGKGQSDTSLILGLGYQLGGFPDSEEDEGRRSLWVIEEASEDPDGWVSVAALGFSLNRGNSESSGLTLTWDTAYRDDEREFFLELGQITHEDNGRTSKDQTRARVQYNRFLSERFYLGGNMSFLRDAEADIDYRVTPAFLAGYAVVKTDTTRLAFEAGPAYTFESLGGMKESYASLVVAERFSHKFNKRFSISQSVEWTAEMADFGNHSLVAEVGLDTKISDRLIWRIVAGYAFENRPAAGRGKHDSSLTSAVAVKF